MSARGRVTRRGGGRTHRSAPTRGGERLGTNGNWRGTMPSPAGRAAWRRGVVTPPYGCNAGGAWQRADVPKAWLPPTKFRAEILGVSHRHRPLRGDGEAAVTTRASGAERASAARMGGRGGDCGRDHPQRGQQPRTIPQSPSGRQLPLHKGAFGDGGCGSPRRPCGPPRDGNGFLSFRGQCAHWPWESVLFTMDGGSGRRT